MKRQSKTIASVRLISLLGLLGVAQLGLADEPWRDLLPEGGLSAWDNGAGGPPPAGWVIEDGAVVRKNRSGDLWTKQRFGNFVLELQFKTEGNSGIFIRTDNPRDCVQTGIEIQIYRPTQTPSRHSCGAIYDCVAPTKEMCREGQWNQITITAKDQFLSVVMNGEPICQMDLDRWTEPHRNPDGSTNKFRTALKDFKREGHIGLQDHGARVAYRKIRIKPLD